MAQEIDTSQETGNKKEREKQEQAVARAQRQEFQRELVEQNRQVSRAPSIRSRQITFIGLAIIAVCAGIFGWLVLLPSGTQAPVAGVAVGAAAPNFTLPVYGGSGSGGTVNLHALRGHPVVVNFWSESCSPCLSEVPYLEQVYSQYGHGRFTLLGVNQADPKDDIARFGASYKLTYSLLFDQGGAVNQAYGVTAIPTTYFIDSSGIVRAAYVTQLSPQTMRQGLASIGVKLP
jgi:cytochrome c biogenesis protein CcmG, thiol:disulfide interchange protein DsbE